MLETRWVADPGFFFFCLTRKGRGGGVLLFQQKELTSKLARQFFFSYGHVSWTRLQKRWFCYAFFIFTPFKCWYLSQMDRYCHESGLVLKLIKGSIPPVNMRLIAFQMGAGCVLEWRMARVVEGGGSGGGKRRGGGSSTHKLYGKNVFRVRFAC